MPPVMPRRIRFPVNAMGRPSLRGWGLYMAIADWPESERPRERLLARGARALSDAELVAILLRTGVRGKSAVDLADDLLRRFGSVAKMLESDLRGIKGLGPAKSAQFAAAFEILRRSLDEKLKERSALT